MRSRMSPNGTGPTPCRQGRAGIRLADVEVTPSPGANTPRRWEICPEGTRHHPRAPLDFPVQPLQSIRCPYPRPVRQREGETGEAIFDLLVQRPRNRWKRPFPACRHAFCGRHRLLAGRRREDFSEILREFFPSSSSHHADEIPSEVQLAPLPTRALEVPINRRFQSSVAIARHESHATQAACREIAEAGVRRRRALGIGHFDRENFPMAIYSDARHDGHASAEDSPALPHMFVASIHTEVGIARLRQRAIAPRCQLCVQLSCQLRDHVLRETGAAQEFGDLTNFSRGDAFDVHFHECQHERLLIALIAGEELR